MRRGGREGGGAGIHQLDGAYHDLGKLGVGGEGAQVLLPKVQIAPGKGLEVGRFGHDIARVFRARL
jgi:hypothetical protein